MLAVWGILIPFQILGKRCWISCSFGLERVLMPSVATWPRWCLLSSGRGLRHTCVSSILTSVSSERYIIPMSTGIISTRASTIFMTRWECMTRCVMSSVTDAIRMLSPGLGNKRMIFATTCSISSRTTMSSA